MKLIHIPTLIYQLIFPPFRHSPRHKLLSALSIVFMDTQAYIFQSHLRLKKELTLRPQAILLEYYLLNIFEKDIKKVKVLQGAHNNSILIKLLYTEGDKDAVKSKLYLHLSPILPFNISIHID